MTPALTLRDVHEGVSPSWWPPAPGWWLLLLLAMAIAGILAWRRRRHQQHEFAILRLFDHAIAEAATPSLQVAAMSELLRRAARRKHPHADALVGDDWLHLLDDGLPQPVFSEGAGALLRDGGFRPEVDARAAEALRVIARERYLDWMRGA